MCASACVRIDSILHHMKREQTVAEAQQVACYGRLTKTDVAVFSLFEMNVGLTMRIDSKASAHLNEVAE